MGALTVSFRLASSACLRSVRFDPNAEVLLALEVIASGIHKMNTMNEEYS